MPTDDERQTKEELLDYSLAELWEWSYEVCEIHQKLVRDSEKGISYEYTIMLRATGEIGSVAAKSYSRWYRSKQKDDWRYGIGDRYIVKLVGPVG